MVIFLEPPPTRSLSAFSRMVMNSNVPPSWALKIHVLELRENVVPPPPYHCQLQVYCNRDSDINWQRGTTQCPPYQAVTGKIYLLKQHFLLPATAWRFVKIRQVVLRKYASCDLLSNMGHVVLKENIENRIKLLESYISNCCLKI